MTDINAGQKIEFANTLRGFAALAVLISHYLGAFWTRRPAVEYLTNTPSLSIDLHPTPTIVTWLNAFPIFNWGAVGVAIFFLISGFVIPFTLRKSSLQGFLANRIFRIFPTYIVGFTITLMGIWLGSKYFENKWPFTATEVLIHYIPGLRDILWSRPIDGIVWTLEIEIRFYLVCALFITWFRS